MEPYTRVGTLVVGAITILGGSIIYVGSLHRQIAVNKEVAEKRIAVVEKQIAVNKEIAQKQIAVAQKETAERFLLYGYAEEFGRYQRTARISKGDDDKDASG
jgi:hypothetical protein